ncbi:uncharacterized protein LOC135333911 [Halichondria panicea]|uniref:uncharacterized protein LOC135333911 n=1 Tax=Halichondria panicea TaxID=6063 RepID=UPI00312BC273
MRNFMKLLWSVLLVGTYSQLGSANNATAVQLTTAHLISLTPTPTATSSNQVSSTHHMTSSKAPSPTSIPAENFFTYKDSEIYLKIHTISITFESASYKNLTGEIIEGMKFVNNTVIRVNSTYTVLKRFYGTDSNPTFFIAFHFTQDSSEDDPKWYLNNFQHASISKNGTVQTLFQYKGIQYSIWAPSGLQYQCTSVVLHGSSGVDGNIGTNLNITGISLQPFLGNKDPSKDIFDCARHSSNNETIGLVVGLSLALAVVIAAVFIIISILASKKFLNREYDILKD